MREEFSAYKKAITRWVTEFVPANLHVELMPWCGWFRPITARRPDWEVAWPDEEWMHP